MNVLNQVNQLAPMLLCNDKVQLVHAQLVRQKVINVVRLLQEDGQDMRETMALIQAVRHAEPWLTFEEETPEEMIGNLFPMLAYDLWLTQDATLINECEKVMAKYVNMVVPGANLQRD